MYPKKNLSSSQLLPLSLLTIGLGAASFVTYFYACRLQDKPLNYFLPDADPKKEAKEKDRVRKG